MLGTAALRPLCWLGLFQVQGTLRKEDKRPSEPSSSSFLLGLCFWALVRLTVLVLEGSFGLPLRGSRDVFAGTGTLLSALAPHRRECCTWATLGFAMHIYPPGSSVIIQSRLALCVFRLRLCGF